MKFFLEQLLQYVVGMLESVFVITIDVNLLAVSLQLQIGDKNLLPLWLPQLHVLLILIWIVLLGMVTTIEELILYFVKILLSLAGFDHFLKILRQRWLVIKEVRLNLRLLGRLINRIVFEWLIGLRECRGVAAFVFAVHDSHKIIAEKWRFN